jgi:UDP-N-acetylmuramoyl-tripeptide--D-alanyl-D-alanine ligase
MAELGDYAPEGHAEVARAVAEVSPDVVIAVGALARVYGGRWVADRTAALDVLRAELRPGDCVLLKGARVLELDRLADDLVPVKAA